MSEHEAWEEGFLAGLKFAEETVGPLSATPQSLRDAIDTNPYNSDSATIPTGLEVPEPNRHPEIIPKVLKAGWRMRYTDGMTPNLFYIQTDATFDPQHDCYKWADPEPKGCGIDDVDWAFEATRDGVPLSP